jgi:hypothetical protein
MIQKPVNKLPRSKQQGIQPKVAIENQRVVLILLQYYIEISERLPVKSFREFVGEKDRISTGGRIGVRPENCPGSDSHKT